MMPRTPQESFIKRFIWVLMATSGPYIQQAKAYTSGQLEAAITYAFTLERGKMDELIRDGFARTFQFSSDRSSETVILTLTNIAKEQRFYAEIVFRRRTLEIILADGSYKTSKRWLIGYLHVCDLKGSDSEECKDAIWQGHGG